MPARDGDTYTLLLGDSQKTFDVECVTSPAAITRGLSGRKSLASGTGMLFIFPDIRQRTMWMPEMNFPLDVVWLDEHLSVVHVTYGMPPCPNRETCPSYSSLYSVKYAIEMPQGDATLYGFSLGLGLSVLPA